MHECTINAIEAMGGEGSHYEVRCLDCDYTRILENEIFAQSVAERHSLNWRPQEEE